MALRLWSRSTNGLSLARLPHFIPACQLLCNNLSTAKASCVAHTPAVENGHAAALEEPSSTSERKERLSRQERTALVESFVIKHMEAHEGAFPSVSAVLKETGGGRNTVKDILNDVESRFTQLTTKQTPLDNSSSGKITSDGTKEENFIVGPAQDVVEDALTDAEVSGTSSEDSEDNDSESDVEEFDSEDVSREETIEIPEVERKSVTFTNGQMIASSHGEIETHSGLWSRLRKLGMAQSPVHASKKKQRSRGTPSVTHELSQDAGRSDSMKENGANPGSVALSFSDAADLEIRNPTQNRGSNGQDFQNHQSEERHGLFIRYLSPQATPADLKGAFSRCGEIIRAQAIKPRPHQKYTYGFVDFKTSEALQKALKLEKVYIKGVPIRKEPSSSSPKIPDRNGNLNPLAVDFSSTRGEEESSGSFLGPSRVQSIRGTGYSVAVEGIPLHIPFIEVKKALSKYGEITLSSKKQEGHGAYIAHVEFKGDDARRRALSAKTVWLNGMHYTILRVDPVKTPVVRLSNVGAATSIEQIQATCELFGQVDKVVTRCEGIVDVYFHSTEVANMPRIMSRLDEVKVEGQLWQAQPSSCMDPSSFLSLMRTTGGQEWLQQESERMLGRVVSALRQIVVDVEDLQQVIKMQKE